MFTGAVNAGMSGGPNVTADGAVAGVNVAHRLDGELVSFLVPAKYAHALYASVAEANANPAVARSAPIDFKPIISQQLLAYQDTMIAKLLATPLSIKTLGPYSVPVRESEQVRCWGSSDAKADKAFSTSKMNCEMESAVYVADDLQTGHIGIDHRFYATTQLHPLRFTRLMKQFLANQVTGDTRSKIFTTPHCAEQFIANKAFSARAVVCVSTLQKFADLYYFTLLLASTDEAQMSVQTRLDLRGVSFANGQKFIRAFLQSYAKEPTP
jgi:serine protease Do